MGLVAGQTEPDVAGQADAPRGQHSSSLFAFLDDCCGCIRSVDVSCSAAPRDAQLVRVKGFDVSSAGSSDEADVMLPADWTRRHQITVKTIITATW